MKCEQLKIHAKLLTKLQEQEFKELTCIQEKCIPEILQGNDVVGQENYVCR
jgi:superfamily II DNA/RNA helicase